MALHCLSYVVYDETGSGWHEEKIANPTWDQVVDSVRRLDKFRYPWVWLFIGDNEDHPTVDCMTIMGGEGVYWVALSAGKYDQLRLFDPDKGNQVVEIWTSDQGFSDYEFHVTSDIELVLRIAKCFGETGEPLPAATWEV
jgi:hypothetical protein